MADTTRENVVAIAPHLDTVEDDPLFNLILDDAARIITSSVYNDDEEMAQRYWVAHVLTQLQNSADGGANIIEEKVDRVEIKLGALKGITDPNRFDTTPYGQQYNLIRKAHIMALHVGN